MTEVNSSRLSSVTARDMAARSVQARRINGIERRIRELVGSEPPLTDEQKRRLTILFNANG